MANRQYSDELRNGAVRRVLDGEPAASVARDLSVSTSTLQRWITQSAVSDADPVSSEPGASPPPAKQCDLQRALTDVMRRIAEVERKLEQFLRRE